MNAKFFFLFVLVSVFGFGQDCKPNNQIIQNLKRTYDIKKNRKDSLFNQFEILKKNIDFNTKADFFSKIEELGAEVKKANESTDSVFYLVNNYKGYLYGYEKCPKKKIDSLFKFVENYQTSPIFRNDIDAGTDETVYLYFGPDKLVNEKDLPTDKQSVPLITDLFNIKSEAYLGDFKVSQRGQKVNLYKNRCLNENGLCVEKIKLFSKSNSKINASDNPKKIVLSILADKKIAFDALIMSVHEGAIKEVYFTAKDENGTQLLYENKFPISLMRFSSIASKTSLLYKGSISRNKKIVIDDQYSNTSVRFSDILMYIPNPGDNYVPDDLALKFPQKDENINTNITYKVMQDTSLKNVIELRAYTDFLALFNSSDNGLVQLEGKADFYINPFNITNSRWFLLKKIVPFVNFSRLDNNSKYIEILGINGNQYTMENFENNSSETQDLRLQALEKAYLDMGFRINLASYAFSKESPFSINLYLPVRYLISNASLGKADQPTNRFELKTFGIGGGLNLSFKKFNNFVLNYSAEMTEFKFAEFNSIPEFKNPGSFWAFTNEAEVSYFPGKQKNQSAFVRFRVITNSEKNIQNSFYQFHFGYRFTIPISTIRN